MRAAAVVTLLITAGCAHFPVHPAAQAQKAKTDDGWEIALTHYAAVGETKGRPIILCHGISANERNMDLEKVSMARWFASQGREVWTMSLRGTGESDSIDKSAGRAGPIRFDDYWKHDLPAVIAHVLKESKADAVDYAGHSMGGMVLYAYLSQGGTGIHAAATLGSPTRLDMGSSMEKLMLGMGPMVSEGWLIPSDLGARMAAPFQGVIDDGPFQRFFYVPGTTELDVWQQLMVHGTAPVSGGTALQLMDMMESGRFLSADKKTDLKADMKNISTPVIVIAGRLDRIAAAPAVKDGYRALGGPKEWLLVTAANGAHGEYGHMDLVIGTRADEDVWQPLLKFLDGH
ncbi:MAG: alpha/beta hydrolase [Archangium sp.]